MNTESSFAETSGSADERYGIRPHMISHFCSSDASIGIPIAVKPSAASGAIPVRAYRLIHVVMLKMIHGCDGRAARQLPSQSAFACPRTPYAALEPDPSLLSKQHDSHGLVANRHCILDLFPLNQGRRIEDVCCASRDEMRLRSKSVSLIRDLLEAAIASVGSLLC